MTSATNHTGTISFSYDTRNRLTSTNDVHSQTVGYGYDDSGNRTSLSLNSVSFATYVYDNDNRLTSLNDVAGGTSITFGYDNANRLTSRNYPNQINTSYEYDGMSRLKRLKDEKLLLPLEDRQYTYNTASQINQIAETLNTKNFSYDNVDRLTGMTSPTLPNENYSFDSVGNRTTSHLSATYTTQSFNRLTATTNETFSYDSNGNMLTKVDSSGTWNYEWDYENRLKKVAKPNNDYVEYEYDSLGRRTKRILNSGTWTKFTYDGLDVVQDQNSSGTNVKYINGLGIDNKLGRITGTSTEYFLKDHLGSTTAITDSLGLVTEQNSYDSFGNPSNTNFSTRYQFTGREYDDFSGLYYYRARWYDSDIGRFISEDPIGFAGGDINLYGYVLNSPLNYKDPNGLDIVVIENGPTGGNPFGHTAIAITNMGVITYGNGNPNIPGQNLLGGSFDGYLKREVSRRKTLLYVIPTTPEQDLAAWQKALDIDYFGAPLTHRTILLDNCSLRSNQILDAAEIPNNNWIPYRVPGSAGNRANNLGIKPYLVPQAKYPRFVSLQPTNYDWKKFEPNY